MFRALRPRAFLFTYVPVARNLRSCRIAFTIHDNTVVSYPIITSILNIKLFSNNNNKEITCTLPWQRGDGHSLQRYQPRGFSSRQPN